MKFFFSLALLFSITFIGFSQEKYLIVGQGGGIAGKTIEYKVTPDGNVLKGSGMVEISYSYYSKISKKQTKKYFQRIESAKSEAFNKPGNVYYFVQFFKDGKETKYTWGANGYSAPNEIKSLYKDIWQNFSKLEFSPVKIEISK